jgi:hypothetical protein
MASDPNLALRLRHPFDPKRLRAMARPQVLSLPVRRKRAQFQSSFQEHPAV